MSTNVSQKDQMLQIIQQTPPQQIAELDFVRKKFIENYNACNKEKQGELMYHRQVVHFKQLIASSDQLKNSDGFSLYACFLTAAVKGYSFDPEDKEIYLIPKGGKAMLWRQAGAHVRRLLQTGQIKYADQPQIVYKGDIIEVKNGRVINHVEKFQTEEMLLGYVRFELDDSGNDRYFIYRKSEWETWRKKSQQPNGENWNYNGSGQPLAGFLKTKIVKHACQEKCWATGTTPATVEVIKGFEIDDLDEILDEELPINERGLVSEVNPTNQQSNRTEDNDFTQGINTTSSGTKTVDVTDF